VTVVRPSQDMLRQAQTHCQKTMVLHV
jgi:hypothetical protein